MQLPKLFAIHVLAALPIATEALSIPSRSHAASLDRRGDGQIKTGYVAFGDSYAAGVGTGMTATGGCRQGQFSYPKLLASQAGGTGDIDFQNLPCSGAIVSEVLQGGGTSQIDDWTNPGNADIATLSIGGNDVGFAKILIACVLRAWQFKSGDCSVELGKAYGYMDPVDSRLKVDMMTAMDQIIKKSGRDDFRLFVTGYPTFFNDETEYCDLTTFYQWQPDHHAFHRPGNWAYLSRELRRDLNDIVRNLNELLSSAVDSVNKLRLTQSPMAIFIDPNEAYNGHRFCEQGAEEPAPGRDDTWFFLSGWPDNALPDNPSGRIASALQDVGELSTPPKVALPGALNCATSFDWSDQMLCGLDSAGLVRQGEHGEMLLDDEISTEEISWYIPTRTVKTFHPRSVGQLAYVNLIKEQL